MDLQINTFLKTLSDHDGYAQNTCQAYGRDLRRFSDFLARSLGQTPQLSDLSGEQLTAFLKAERKSGLSASTLYRRRSSVRLFIQFLNQQNLLTLDLGEEKPLLRPKERRKGIYARQLTCLKPHVVERLLASISEVENARAYRDLAIITMMLELGISIGTLVALDLADLDLREARLRLRMDGGEQIALPIPNTTPALQKYLRLGRADLTQSVQEEALFVSQMGRRISRQGIWQLIRNSGQQAKIKQSLSARVMRNTAVRMMLVEKRTMKEIQRSLGHSNPLSTTALVRRVRKNCKL